MPINATWYISQPSSTPESHSSTTVCEVWGFVLALLAVVLHEVCDFFPTTFVVCAHAQNHNRATVGSFSCFTLQPFLPLFTPLCAPGGSLYSPSPVTE